MARTWLYTLMMVTALIALEGIKPAAAMDHFYSVLYTMPYGHAVPRMPNYTPPPPPPEFAMNDDGTYVGEAPFAIRAAQDYQHDCVSYRCNPPSGPTGCTCKGMKSPSGGVAPLTQNVEMSESR